MKATAGTITKLLTSYNFAKFLFTSQQLGDKVLLEVDDAIAYNHDAYMRLIELLQGKGYSVDLIGRRGFYITKAGA